MKAVQSISRALAVLRVLAARDGQSANAVAAASGLSRGTCHRLLETLREEGCVALDPVDRRYWLGAEIALFARAQQASRWLRDGALPLMNALTDRLLWPVSLVEPRDGRMVLLASTDRRSSLTRVRVPPDFSVPLATSASGQVYAAFASDTRLATALGEGLGRDTDCSPAMLAGIRRDGYKLTVWPQQVYTLAVPVLRDGEAQACLALRVFSSVMPPDQVVARFLADLQRTAETIGSLENCSR